MGMNPLNLSAKLLQPAVSPAVKAVAAGASLLAPVVVELDPTTFCDLACPECISGSLLNAGGFAADRLIALADEFVASGVRAVVLIGGGEPLLHEATSRVVEILGTGGVAVGVTTNGTHIDRHLSALSTWAAWVRVSVDAATPETYQLMRPHASGRSQFERVIANMKDFASVKSGRLGFSFLVLTRQDSTGEIVTNASEIAAAATLAKSIGCDYFEVKPAYDQGHFLIGQRSDVATITIEQVAAAKDLEDSSFSVISPVTLPEVTEHKSSEQPKDYHRCPVAELRTLVTPTGCYICPYHRGRPEMRYGNVLEESFASVWNSSRRAHTMSNVDPAVDCRFHCIRHESNLMLLGQLGGTEVGHCTNEVPDYFL